ncbi:MAG: T9SS type A sorting domain-containing protein [candidate division WOR-3 bacterium]
MKILLLLMVSDVSVVRFNKGFAAYEAYFPFEYEGEPITWRLGLGLVATENGLRIRGQDTDLDDNGWPDVTVSCGEWVVDSVFRVFLNNEGNFDLHGVQYAWGDKVFLDGHSISDFNANGLPDLVIDIMGNFEYPDNAQVYSLLLWDWPWSSGRIDSLASWCTEASVSADLNGDGYEDLIMAVFRDSISGLNTTRSAIYWGGPRGFSDKNKTLLSTLGCHGTTIADLNRDGYLDLVFANTYASWGPDSVDSYIYWGGPDGYSEAKRTPLDTYGAYGVTVGDINRDGWLDLVFPQRETEKSAIFYGSPAGFSYYPSMRLYSKGATAAWLEDLNTDGWLDLILARKITNQHPETIIYWNRDGFFSNEDTTCLPAPGGYGLFCEDYNRDGWPDILIISKENSSSDYNTYSLIYYNQGRPPYFSRSSRVDTLPVFAAGRGRTMDFPGNVYDRKPRHTIIVDAPSSKLGTTIDSIMVFGETLGATIKARYQCVDPTGTKIWLPPGAGYPSLGLRVALEIWFDPRYASVFRLDSVYLFWHECPEPSVIPKGLLWTSLRGDTLYFYSPTDNSRVDVYNILGQKVTSMDAEAPGGFALSVPGTSGIYIARLVSGGKELRRLVWRKVR